ncbi:MAG: PQQ-binding-like beta-propeller repeat protein [Thermomicrobiales bacterium]
MLSRPSQAAINLSTYWNALQSGASADDLERLAALVEPSDLEAIHRVRTMHQPRRPDPQFALRLERILMNAASHPASQAMLLPRIPTRHDRSPGRCGPSHPKTYPRSLAHYGSIALRVALVLLMIVLMASGIWLFTRHDGNQQIATPPVATPTVQTSPDVPMYRGNPARTGVFPGPALVGSPVELWKIQATEPINLGAAVVDGVIYIPAGNNGFEARDAMTGALVWSFATDAPAVSAPAVVDGMAYVIDGDGTLYAVQTKGGTEAWRMANLNVNASVVPIDGALYAVSPEGTFYDLDAATGATRWQAELGAESAGGMAVADGVAFQGNAAGMMTAFDATTGEVLWTFQNEEGRGNATVTVANGQVYIAISGDEVNALYAVDAKTGGQMWRQEQGAGAGFISATATDTRLYSVAEDGMLHALDAATGETVWTYQLQEFVRSIPVLVEDALYVADNGGFVRAIDAETGKQDWEYPIEGAVDRGWPVVANGVLYIGTDFGNFYAITGSRMLAARDITSSDAETSSLATPSPATPVTDPIDINTARVLWQSGPDANIVANMASIGIGPDGITYALDGDHHDIAMFGPDGALLGRWGKPGSGPGEFRFSNQAVTAGSIGFDADGNIYVFDSVNNRIQKFGPDRTFIKEWGSAGTAEGHFNIPFGTVDAANGRVWAVEFGSNRVQVFDLDGNLLDVWGESGSGPGQLFSPAAIAIMPDGSVYVAEEATRRIQHFTADGEFLGVLDQPETGSGVVYGMAVDVDGNLWTASANPARVVVYRPDGTMLAMFDTLPGGESLGVPVSLAIDRNGNVAILAVSGDGSEYSEQQRDATNRVLLLDFTPDTSPAASPNATPEVTPAT